MAPKCKRTESKLPESLKDLSCTEDPNPCASGLSLQFLGLNMPGLPARIVRQITIAWPYCCENMPPPYVQVSNIYCSCEAIRPAGFNCPRWGLEFRVNDVEHETELKSTRFTLSVLGPWGTRGNMYLPLHSSQKASVALQLNRLQPWSHETVNLNSICVDLDPARRLINSLTMPSFPQFAQLLRK